MRTRVQNLAAGANPPLPPMLPLMPFCHCACAHFQAVINCSQCAGVNVCPRLPRRLRCRRLPWRWVARRRCPSATVGAAGTQPSRATWTSSRCARVAHPGERLQGGALSARWPPSAACSTRPSCAWRPSHSTPERHSCFARASSGAQRRGTYPCPRPRRVAPASSAAPAAWRRQ